MFHMIPGPAHREKREAVNCCICSTVLLPSLKESSLLSISKWVLVKLELILCVNIEENQNSIFY